MREETFTARQAAAVLGLSRETVIRWCRLGRFTGALVPYGARKIGWRIPREVVYRMARENGNEPVSNTVSA